MVNKSQGSSHLYLSQGISHFIWSNSVGSGLFLEGQIRIQYFFLRADTDQGQLNPGVPFLLWVHGLGHLGLLHGPDAFVGGAAIAGRRVEAAQQFVKGTFRHLKGNILQYFSDIPSKREKNFIVKIAKLSSFYYNLFG